MKPAVYISRQGPCEPVNADHVEHWTIPNGQVLLVCDGIDHNYHTVSVVHLFCHYFKETDWSSTRNPTSLLNKNILQVINTLKPEKDVAFCLVVALFVGDKLVIGHCGDCRAGYLSDNGVEWLTADDVPFLDMYQKGSLSKENYEAYRHYLSCKLKTGQDNSNVIKIQSLQRPAPDVLLLCSDGFWAEKEHLLTGAPSHCLDIIRKAIPVLNTTAKDNFSVIVV